MNKDDFVKYIMSNVISLEEVEIKLILSFLKNINESFIEDLLQVLVESKFKINFKTLTISYNELLDREALTLARNSRINYNNDEERYLYDHYEVLKEYYLKKLKQNRIKKGELK